MIDTGSKVARIGEVLHTPKTAELIATHLRRQIVRRELKPGDTLPRESQLMEQYGVSRPTLREAYRILETELLITVRRGARGGAQVMEPDTSVAARYVGVLLQVQGTTINDVYEARMISEPACAALLAKARKKIDLADLTAVVDELEASLESAKDSIPGAVRWTQLTARFHELIMLRCGNKTLALQGAVLQDIVATHVRARVATGFDLSESPDRFLKTIRAYRKLITLVDQRDAPAAEKHWRAHMEAAAKFLLKDDLRNKPVVDLFD